MNYPVAGKSVEVYVRGIRMSSNDSLPEPSDRLRYLVVMSDWRGVPCRIAHFGSGFEAVVMQLIKVLLWILRTR